MKKLTFFALISIVILTFSINGYAQYGPYQYSEPIGSYYNYGWNQPYNNGWNQPYSYGWNQAYNNGWNQPYSYGWNQPYNNGWNQPYSYGWNQPYNPYYNPYNQPYNNGWNQPYNDRRSYLDYPPYSAPYYYIYGITESPMSWPTEWFNPENAMYF